MSFSSVLGFDPYRIYGPVEPQVDDDYLTERKDSGKDDDWYFDPDEE